MKIEGTVWKFGDNIDTDVIIPAPYLVTTDPEELGKHCMEGIDASLSAKIQAGDIIVAGQNFGCGSSREHAPMAIKGAGISCVVAESFARIFFRNAFNMGLAIFEATGVSVGVNGGDRMSVHQETGKITDHTNGKIFSANPIPAFMKELIAAGGLMPYILKQQRAG
ncbi:MAG: 3-isopropylmalate dehydratase small subunit [Desulfobacterales bacterium S7086C20]|nr:MAG: 3-isopropylmalate dehydratase small subunit [Desulfobacterales bacterium S7086C20]